jgi:hypothetical protein
MNDNNDDIVYNTDGNGNNGMIMEEEDMLIVLY